jgi:hypothetical protein
MSSAVDTSPVLPEFAEHTGDPLPLRGTRIVVIVLALGCAAVQLVANDANDTYVMAALAGTVMTFYALRSSVLRAAPLSSLALIGFGLLTFWLPLVATAFEGKALTFELLRPDLTFGFSLIVFAVLILAHALYARSKTLIGLRLLLTHRILVPLRIFKVPSPVQLFAIGFVGLAAMFLVSFGFGAKQGEEAGNVVLKVLEGLFFLAYAPFIALLYPLANQPLLRFRTLVMPLTFFAIGLLIAGSARNSRSAVVFGLASIFVGVILGGWLGVFPARIFRLRNFVVAALAGFILFAAGTRLATAMLVVRTEHYTASPLEYVHLTLAAFLDGDAISTFDSTEYDLMAHQRQYSWDEYYLDNLFLARLCNPRFTDNTLAIVSQLDAFGRAEIRSHELAACLTILPQPILELTGVSIDKEALRGSMGSFIYYVMTSKAEARGTFRTGSFIASAWACSGVFFPLVIGLIATLLYPVIDSFSLTSRAGDQVAIAAVAILSLYTTAVVFTSAALGTESLAEFVRLLLRDIPQQTVLFAVVYWGMRGIATR